MFVCLVDSFLILMSWSLLFILGTYVLVLSVTKFIISYPNTEIDKSMIFVFTSRIHIPHHLRNLQRCEHDVFSYLTSSWRCLYFWDNLWSSVPYHHKCSIKYWKDLFWIYFFFCCDDDSPFFLWFILEWTVRDWSIVAPIFSYLVMNRASSGV